MTLLTNYVQLLWLNFMLIVLTMGYTHTAIVLYIMASAFSSVVTIIVREIIVQMDKGKIPSIPEFQLFPRSYTDEYMIIYIMSSVIHATLAFTLLNSLIIPLIIFALLLLRYRTARTLKDYLCRL